MSVERAYVLCGLVQQCTELQQSPSHGTSCERYTDCDTYSCKLALKKSSTISHERRDSTDDYGTTVLINRQVNLLSFQMRVSAEVKVILSVHPEQRTEQQLAKV